MDWWSSFATNIASGTVANLLTGALKSVRRSNPPAVVISETRHVDHGQLADEFTLAEEDLLSALYRSVGQVGLLCPRTSSNQLPQILIDERVFGCHTDLEKNRRYRAALENLIHRGAVRWVNGTRQAFELVPRNCS